MLFGLNPANREWPLTNGLPGETRPSLEGPDLSQVGTPSSSPEWPKPGSWQLAAESQV